jgi:hypothetical protein
MSIQFICPTCGARLTAPDAAAGLAMNCPRCRELIRVPEPRAVRKDPGAAGPPAKYTDEERAALVAAIVRAPMNPLTPAHTGQLQVTLAGPSALDRQGSPSRVDPVSVVLVTLIFVGIGLIGLMYVPKKAPSTVAFAPTPVRPMPVRTQTQQPATEPAPRLTVEPKTAVAETGKLSKSAKDVTPGDLFDLAKKLKVLEDVDRAKRAEAIADEMVRHMRRGQANLRRIHAVAVELNQLFNDPVELSRIAVDERERLLRMRDEVVELRRENETLPDKVVALAAEGFRLMKEVAPMLAEEAAVKALEAARAKELAEEEAAQKAHEAARAKVEADRRAAEEAAQKAAEAAKAKKEADRRAAEKAKKAAEEAAKKAAEEKTAEAKLTLAQALLPDAKDKARARLEQIVKDHPGTKAADEARKLLDKLK